MPNITTSIPQELWNKAKEKNLKWNECMIAGIKVLSGARLPMAYGETIETESVISKKIKQVNIMQEKINELNNELDKRTRKRNS